MRRFLGIGLVIAVFGVLGYAFFFGSEPDIVNYPPEGDTIVAFGDSLVTGYGSPDGGFVHYLSEDIGKPIINMGANGDTTANALERVDDVIAQNPDIVIALLGGNDYLQKIDKADTFRNLSRIVTRLQEADAVVVLLGVRGGLLRDTYAGDFSDFADEHGVAFMPNVLDNVIGNPQLMHDVIHPNNAGHKRIAEKVAPVLKEMLAVQQ